VTCCLYAVVKVSSRLQVDWPVLCMYTDIPSGQQSRRNIIDEGMYIVFIKYVRKS